MGQEDDNTQIFQAADFEGKMLSKHPKLILFLYSLSVGAAYAYALFVLSSVALSGRADTAQAINVSLALSCIFVVILVWSRILLYNIRNLYSVIFPKVARTKVFSGILEFRSMTPGTAISVLEQISSLDRFKGLLTNPTIMIVTPLSSSIVWAALIIAHLKLAEVLFTFGVFALLMMLLLVFWVPSFVLSSISPRERLYSALSIMLFLNAHRKDIRKSKYFLLIKGETYGRERFLVQNVPRFFDEYLRETAPALAVDVSRQIAAIYTALSFQNAEKKEFEAAAEILEELRDALHAEDTDPARTQRIFETVYCTKDRIPKAWKFVEDGNLSIKPAKQAGVGTYVQFVMSLMVPPFIALVLRFLGLA